MSYKPELTPRQRQWLIAKWKQVRLSQQKADAANNAWNELNEALNNFLDREGTTDPLQRDKVKGQNLELKGHLETGKWNAANAQRHCDDINTFFKMKEWGLL